MRKIFYLFVLTFLISGCEKKANMDEAAAVTISDVKMPAKAESMSGTSINIPQKIVKNASLRFEAENLEDTYKQIITAVKVNHGTIISDAEGKDYSSVYRNLSLKVPSQNFDAFLQSVSKGVAYFEEKTITSEDVTEEYIDLNSRIKTKQKLENRYIEILQKATKISEILEIEKQISIIREEIEAKEGRLKYLESRVAESHITINFYKNIAEKQSVQVSFGSKLWNAVQSGFFGISSFFIWLVSVWPFIILIFVLAYFIRKRFKRKKI